MGHERKPKSREELITLLNANFAEELNRVPRDEQDEIKGCGFDSESIESHEPDQEGCNWTVSPYGFRCSGHTPETARSLAIKVVQDARMRYWLDELSDTDR